MGIGFVKKPGAIARAIAPIEKRAHLHSSEVRRVPVGSDGSRFLERALSGRLTYSKMFEIYKRNIWVRAIIDKIVDRLSVIEPIIKPVLKPGKALPSAAQQTRVNRVQELLQNPNDRRESFMSLRKKYFRDSLIYDAAALAVERNINENSIFEERNIPLAMYAAPGDEIRLNVDITGQFVTPELAYSQVQTGQVVEVWGIDEMIYFVANPKAGSVYGISPIESLVQTVTAELYASAYNVDFFANNATPRLAIMFDNMGASQSAEAKMRRFQTYWEQELKGKPHKPIFLGSETGEVDIQKLNYSNEDMQFQEYSKWLLVKIMAIYNMQPIVLGVIDVSMGKLNSAQQQYQFKEDALKPKLKLEAYHLNSELVWPSTSFGYRDIYIDYEAVDLMDLETLARVFLMARKGGWLEVNEMRNIVGLPPMAVAVGEPFEPENAQVTQDMYNSLAYVAGLTPDQARQYRPTRKGVPTGLEELESLDLTQIITKIIEERARKTSKITLLDGGETLHLEDVGEV